MSEEQQARFNAFWAKVEAAGEAGLFDLPADHPRAAGCKIPNQAVLNLEVPLCPDVVAAIGVESLTLMINKGYGGCHPPTQFPSPRSVVTR